MNISGYYSINTLKYIQSHGQGQQIFFVSVRRLQIFFNHYANLLLLLPIRSWFIYNILSALWFKIS